MTIEGHERCIPIEKYKQLQELHDNQKKIIASQQQKIEDLEDRIKDLVREASETST